MSHENQITTIRDFVPTLRALVADLSDEQLVTHYIEGEWTVAQNVHHLYDAHNNAYQLCKRVLTEENAGLNWALQDELANLPDAKHADIEPSLLGLEGLHARWADMFSHVDNWGKSGTSLKSGKTYTIERLLEIYANHCANHLHQIQDVLDAM